MAVAETVVDTSALARMHHPSVQSVLAPLLIAGRAAICITTEVELLWSTRSAAEYDEVATHWAHAESLPVEPVDWRRAIAVQRSLWGSGRHRAVGWNDLLLAAVAERHRVAVLHYDRDFDLVAEVTGQASRWVVAQGSVA